jgi:hypothetical protein
LLSQFGQRLLTLRAASATLALKVEAWVRRVRFVILTPDPRHHRRFQAEFPPIGLSEFARPPLGCDGLINPEAKRGSMLLHHVQGHDPHNLKAKLDLIAGKFDPGPRM